MNSFSFKEAKPTLPVDTFSYDGSFELLSYFCKFSLKS